MYLLDPCTYVYKHSPEYAGKKKRNPKNGDQKGAEAGEISTSQEEEEEGVLGGG